MVMIDCLRKHFPTKLEKKRRKTRQLWWRSLLLLRSGKKSDASTLPASDLVLKDSKRNLGVSDIPFIEKVPVNRTIDWAERRVHIKWDRLCAFKTCQCSKICRNLTIWTIEKLGSMCKTKKMLQAASFFIWPSWRNTSMDYVVLIIGVSGICTVVELANIDTAQAVAAYLNTLLGGWRQLHLGTWSAR